MLENSNLIEGKTAKRVNELLKDYQAVTAQLVDLETSKKAILKELFELAPVGVNETNLFTFKVSEQAGRQSLSLKSLQESAPELFGRVSALGLISVGENFKTVRSIKLKGDRV
jgi:hypothetical protein